MDPDSIHMDPDSIHMDPDSIHIGEIPETKWDELIKIAESARQNRHLPPKQIELTLLELCQNHWLTRKQLSELLERNSAGLLSRFLTPMVGHGLLRLRYPDKPNRVDQAYTTNTPSD